MLDKIHYGDSMSTRADKFNNLLDAFYRLAEMVNVHEREIDKLQTKAEPEKSEVLVNTIDDTPKTKTESTLAEKYERLECAIIRMSELYTLAKGTLTPKSYKWEEVANSMATVACKAIKEVRG